MYRCILVAGLMPLLSACAGITPGKVILTEDNKDQYVQLREGKAGYVLVRNGRVENRPDLNELREVHGDLKFVCSEIHGVDNPRIVIESKNKAHFQVLYKWGDQDVLKVIAKPLGLVVAQEEREIQAITIRVAEGGHRAKAAAKGKGVTANDLARFLETRYRRPVVNLTSLEGSWSILLSAKAERSWPKANEKTKLDDLGLELQWEKVKISVTVVKDAAK